MFIMVDGIDGSGKSSVVAAWKEYLAGEGNAIFDLRTCLKEKGEYPAWDEVKPYDFVFSNEPTNAGIGRVIRHEMIKNGAGYPEEAVAEAYSLDRLILYNKIIVPALLDNKCIIQDRGISTSLCYQAISGKLNLNFINSLPGNALAWHYPPNHLILFKSDPKLALERLAVREHKKDDAIFEKLDFQIKAANLFYSEEYKAIFTSQGTQVHYLSADVELGIMVKESLGLLKEILGKILSKN